MYQINSPTSVGQIDFEFTEQFQVAEIHSAVRSVPVNRLFYPSRKILHYRENVCPRNIVAFAVVFLFPRSSDLIRQCREVRQKTHEPEPRMVTKVETKKLQSERSNGLSLNAFFAESRGSKSMYVLL